MPSLNCGSTGRLTPPSRPPPGGKPGSLLRGPWLWLVAARKRLTGLPGLPAAGSLRAILAILAVVTIEAVVPVVASPGGWNFC